jgi:exonuclease SbcC
LPAVEHLQKTLVFCYFDNYVLNLCKYWDGMIPLQLTLKNFFSYREACVDFRGLHTACICGANGAGKSSLLEAITWTIWGESRAASEDDVIHTGAINARVDFQFSSNEQTYRIIRTRQRGKGSSLDFQIATGSSFRSLSGKNLRDTQEQIINYLKLDYDTFINSAYLRQGRADEFMQRRPTERKQILADLLKLDHYEKLANQAKDLSKQYKGQAEQLQASLEPLEAQIAQQPNLREQVNTLETEIQALQSLQEAEEEKLRQLRIGENQRENWQKQLIFQENQYQAAREDCDRLLQEQNQLQHQIHQLHTLLAQSNQISSQYTNLVQLRQREEILSGKLQAYQEAREKKQTLEQQLSQTSNSLNLEIQKLQTRLESLSQEEQNLTKILRQAPEVEEGMTKLRMYRQRLHQMDLLQNQAAPLLQQRQSLETEVKTIKAQLTAKLEQLQHTESQLLLQLATIPNLRQQALEVDAQIDALNKKQAYYENLEQKGKEQSSHKEHLNYQKHTYTEQLNELQQKLELLTVPNPICPLCEQGLNDHHRQQIVAKTHAQQQLLNNHIWQIEEDGVKLEQKLQKLRQEYQEIKQELAQRSSLEQLFGQLEAQIEAGMNNHINLQKIRQEIKQTSHLLLMENYGLEIKKQLELVSNSLANLNYNEQTHALLRGEEKQLKWAEIKQSQLQDAHRRQGEINHDKPPLQESLHQLQWQLKELEQSSSLSQELTQVVQYLQALNYDHQQHQDLMQSLRQAQVWESRYKELEQAQQQHPELLQKLEKLSQTLESRNKDKEAIKQSLETIVEQIDTINDHREAIDTLTQSLQTRRENLDQLISQRGRLEQSLEQVKLLQQQVIDTQSQLQAIQKKYRVYQELSLAFGKNGIQTLMIENILPQLEAATNHILARLTGNQFHVMFLTQKAGKGKSKKNTKMIDTLEIVIADTQGTRPYETYSGGEAFRINFSIRLALARLLAQRAGTSLQMLIVDEGFGTQDSEGCDRLIAAINAIASDFACILTVTHMPQFKEAFAHRLEVRKTSQGSQVYLL